MPLDHDTSVTISLIGTAERLHGLRGDREAAIEQLRTIANGRTDLLAKAAGHYQGSDTWNALACYRLLVDAGADVRLIPAAAERTRWNLEHYNHTSAGTTAPGSTLSP